MGLQSNSLDFAPEYPEQGALSDVCALITILPQASEQGLAGRVTNRIV